MTRLAFRFVLLAMLSLPAAAQTAITEPIEPIEPNGWSGGPRPVALRCAGLLDVLLSVQPSPQLHAAQSLLLVEAARLAEAAGDPQGGVTELKAFANAYLTLPQHPDTQTIVGADIQSCMIFVQVLQGGAK